MRVFKQDLTSFINSPNDRFPIVVRGHKKDGTNINLIEGIIEEYQHVAVGMKYKDYEISVTSKDWTIAVYKDDKVIEEFCDLESAIQFIESNSQKG